MSFFGFVLVFWFLGGRFIHFVGFFVCFIEDLVRKQLKHPVVPRNNFPARDLFPHFISFLAQTTSHREAFMFLLHNYCGLN